MRWTLIAAALAVACSKPDVSELRADNKELRSELREIREELREIRAEQRDLRKLIDGETADEPDPDPAPAIDAGPAPELPATDGGPAPAQSDVKLVIQSNPPGALVWHGDRKLGRTPLLYEHPPGTKPLMLRIEKPGYRPRLFTVRPDEDAKFSFQLSRQKKKKKKK